MKIDDEIRCPNCERFTMYLVSVDGVELAGLSKTDRALAMLGRTSNPKLIYDCNSCSARAITYRNRPLPSASWQAASCLFIMLTLGLIAFGAFIVFWLANS